MSSVDDPPVALSADQTPEGWSDHAEAYDDRLAPVTARFAADVVRALELHPGMRFLDVGAGTGSLSLAAARSGAQVLATDFAPGMVALLRRRFAEAGLAVQAEVMDGQALDVESRSMDAAASLFGLIFFPDLAAGARELHRVLRIGGRAAIAAWAPGGFLIQKLAVEALIEVRPGRTAPRTLPAAFRLSDPAALETLLLEAGFGDVALQEIEHRLLIADPAEFFEAIPTWAAPMRPAFERLEPDRRSAAAADFADRVRAASDDEGLPLRALIALGSR